MKALRIAVIGMLAWLPLPAVAETYLLMAEEMGCPWCARWDAEISSAYPKTAEGRAAPLVRYDIHAGPPDGVTLTRSVRFTPTFILVKHGQEVGRLEGYPGENFFWGLLGMMLKDADVHFEGTG